MAKVTYRVEGLDCAEEVTSLRAELLPLVGVKDVACNILDHTVTIEYDERLPNVQVLAAAIRRAGLEARPATATTVAEEGTGPAPNRQLLATVASGVMLALGLLLHLFASPPSLQDGLGPLPNAIRLCYLLAIVAGGWYVYPKARAAAWRLRPDMNLLMSVAVVGALLLGEWFEAAHRIVSVRLVADVGVLECVAGAAGDRCSPANRAGPGPSAAAQRQRDNARRGEHQGRHRILVKPGEKIPLDGQVVAGHTTVDQASITGESLPVAKAVGDTVYAGTLNRDGAVEIQTTKGAGETMSARIVQLVREAQARRAPSEQWVDRFARVYTPAVMVLALAIAVVPPLLGGVWTTWFYEALVLLVIACPCALVISTPVSIVAALTAAARHGVLIKGGAFVEIAGQLRAIAIDKTGTLTEGQPTVTRVVPLEGYTEKQLLQMAVALERRSEHPLAQALVSYAAQRGIRSEAVEGFQALPGRGATGRLQGRQIWAGSHRYLAERGHEQPQDQRVLEELAADGSSVVVVGTDAQLCGFITLADRVRPNAAAAMREIKAQGIAHILLLTGDNRPTAQAIAATCGIDEYRAELLPQDKTAAVEELARRFGTVAMVGDGVNDAPALATANLGIAMGAIGSDAAMETADIVLMTDDLSRLPWLVRYSRRTLNIIRQNIAASLVIKGLFVLLAFAGYASLWAAIAADMGVSLAVVFNALRLLRG